MNEMLNRWPSNYTNGDGVHFVFFYVEFIFSHFTRLNHCICYARKPTKKQMHKTFWQSSVNPNRKRKCLIRASDINEFFNALHCLQWQRNLKRSFQLHNLSFGRPLKFFSSTRHFLSIYQICNICLDVYRIMCVLRRWRTLKKKATTKSEVLTAI